MCRRNVLETIGAGAVGAACAGFVTGAAATNVENLTWRLGTDIYDLLPAHPGNDPNVLVHRTGQFQGRSGITEGSGNSGSYNRLW